MNMNGYMAVGRVVRVHYKSGTADVVLVNTGDTIKSDPTNEGRFAARILASCAHFDEVNKKSWGVIEPIAVGSLVLVAFLENMKNRPIIIGKFHRPENHNNILHAQYEPLLDTTSTFYKREGLKYLRVFPSQLYHRVDGLGNIELTLPTKSFLTVVGTGSDSRGDVTDDHNGFDFDNLTERDKFTGQTLQSNDPLMQTPSKILFVHRTSFSDPTTWTKVYLDDEGMFRLTRDTNDGTLSYVTVNADGSMKLRRQLDSSDHESGNQHAEISIATNGDIQITHPSGSFIRFSGNDITIQAVGSVHINQQQG